MWAAELPGFAPFVLAGFLGLCLGSFATALAWRLPRDLPWVKARSVCTSCGHVLSALDLVPFFSWLFLRGKCRYCGNKIGWQYFAIETATMAFCLALCAKYGLTWAVLPIYLLPPVLAAAMDIDLRYKILPDILNIGVAVAALMAIFAQALSSDFFAPLLVQWLQTGLLGALLYGGGSYALRQLFMWRMKREALGLGDVKLFGAIGLWFGTDADMFSVFLLLTGITGVMIALVWRQGSGEREFPFGPAIIFAFVCVLLWRAPYFLT